MENKSPEAAYYTKSNIVRPVPPIPADRVAADQAAADAKARADIQALHGVNAAATLSGGAIKHGVS